jgi:hypothetical protein
MKASFPANELGDASKRVLEELGYEFYVNKTIEITEFEVIKPASILLRVTRLPVEPPMTRMGTLFGWTDGPRNRGETCELEIVVREKNSSSLQVAALFVDRLVSTLTKKPWQGLGSFERAAWNSWLGTVQGR